jgi:hypothetical protein
MYGRNNQRAMTGVIVSKKLSVMPKGYRTFVPASGHGKTGEVNSQPGDLSDY